MQRHAKERDEEGSKRSMDRISQLPQPILHHVLYFLSQNDAVRTCVLSKSWRYLGSTRPNVEFRESSFKGNKEKLRSVLDKTLQWYHDQKLSIQHFILEMKMVDPKSVLLLERWIPIVILHMCVKTFDLSFHSKESKYFNLPSIVLKSESLQELFLQRCKLGQIDSTDMIRLKKLQTLKLKQVYIAEATLEMILSSCPLIEHVSIRVNKPNGLGYISINDKQEDLISIEVGTPSFETIRVKGCCWFCHPNYFLPNLTCLFLESVPLSSESFGFFSGDYLPRLESLSIHSCYGFKEFHMYLSGSVKHLSLSFTKMSNEVIEASIDAPNIVTFLYKGDIPQSPISFTTASREWKSYLIFLSSGTYFHKLSELLKALSQSQISLELSQPLVSNYQLHIEKAPPVEVEHLSLRGYHSSSTLVDFLNCLFRICRPRYMDQHLYSIDAKTEYQWETNDKKLNEFLLRFLLMKSQLRRYYWPQDLMEVSLEGLVKNGQKHHPFQGVKFLFRLKWKE